MWRSRYIANILVAWLLAGCSPEPTAYTISLDSPVGSSVSEPRRTIIHFQNGSDTEPDADLEIKHNDSIVFSGSVRFNNIPDDWYDQVIRDADTVTTHRISILNKENGVRLDTLVRSADSVVHVFLSYNYHKITPEEKQRFKKNALYPGEEKIIQKMFAHPKGFSVLVMHGQVSIP
jgi:hypothetical protein